MQGAGGAGLPGVRHRQRAQLPGALGRGFPPRRPPHLLGGLQRPAAEQGALEGSVPVCSGLLAGCPEFSACLCPSGSRSTSASSWLALGCTAPSTDPLITK